MTQPDFSTLGYCTECTRVRYLAEVGETTEGFDPPTEGVCTQCVRERGGPLLAEVYFAYGMNLAPGAMRYGGYEKVGPAVLHGWKLTFRGFADIEPAKGETVQGGLWKMTPQLLREMDGREGYPRLYDRKVVPVETEHGVAVEAMVYFMQDQANRPIQEPWEGYLGQIRKGYEFFGLPQEALTAAVAAATEEAARA